MKIDHPVCSFSSDRKYRYTLWREWQDLFASKHQGIVMFIGLNPSTADEALDDPTIRKCMGFVRRWGYAGLCMCNLFAFRATDPKEMKKQPDPVGPENNQFLADVAKEAPLIIAAWGKHGSFMARDAAVQTLLAKRRIHCLSQNDDGSPEHPLYVPYITEPKIFRP